MALFRFFASGEVGDEQGAERTNSRNQRSVRTNLNITPNSKVDIATSVGYINSNTQLSCEAGCGGAMWESMYSNPANLPQFCAPRATSAARTYAASIARRPKRTTCQYDASGSEPLHRKRHGPVAAVRVDVAPLRDRHGLQHREQPRDSAVHHERHRRVLLGHPRQGIALRRPTPGHLQHIRLHGQPQLQPDEHACRRRRR